MYETRNAIHFPILDVSHFLSQLYKIWHFLTHTYITNSACERWQNYQIRLCVYESQYLHIAYKLTMTYTHIQVQLTGQCIPFCCVIPAALPPLSLFNGASLCWLLLNSQQYFFFFYLFQVFICIMEGKIFRKTTRTNVEIGICTF